MLIFEIKAMFVKLMLEWNLEEAYWILRRLESEINAKLNEKTEAVESIEIMNNLEMKRNEYHKTINVLDNVYAKSIAVNLKDLLK